MDAHDDLPLSALAHLVYCERRAALVHVVGIWIDNQYTVAGKIIHERPDSGEETNRPGIHVLRSVHVRSERLRLAGVADLVEVHGVGADRRFVPVETKRGRRRRHANDEVQLCAQAIAIEEMTGATIPEGVIFHAGSKRRRIVKLTPELRAQTENAATRLHAMVAAMQVPPPVADERCPDCSLREACQPNSLLPAGSLVTLLRRALE